MKPEVPAHIDPDQPLTQEQLKAISWLSNRALREAVKAGRVRSRPVAGDGRGTMILVPRELAEDMEKLPRCSAPGCDMPALTDGGTCGQRGHAKRGRPRAPGDYYNVRKTPAAKAGKLSLTRAAARFGCDRVVLRTRIERGDVLVERVGREYWIDPAEAERVEREFVCKSDGCDAVALGETGHCGAHAGAAEWTGTTRPAEVGGRISAAKKGHASRSEFGLTIPQAASVAGLSREPFRKLVKAGVFQAVEIPEGAGTGYRLDPVRLVDDLTLARCSSPGCDRLAEPNGYCPTHDYWRGLENEVTADGAFTVAAAASRAHFTAGAIYRAIREGRLPSVLRGSGGRRIRVILPEDLEAYPPPAKRARTRGGRSIACECGNERYLAPSHLVRGRRVCAHCRLEELRDWRHWAPLVELALLRRAGFPLDTLSDAERHQYIHARARDRVRRLGILRRGRPRQERLKEHLVETGAAVLDEELRGRAAPVRFAELLDAVAERDWVAHPDDWGREKYPALDQPGSPARKKARDRVRYLAAPELEASLADYHARISAR